MADNHNIPALAKRWNEIQKEKKALSTEIKEITPHLIAFLQTSDQDGFLCDNGEKVICLKKLGGKKIPVNQKHITDRLTVFFEDAQTTKSMTFSGTPVEIAVTAVEQIYADRDMPEEEDDEPRFTLMKKPVPKPKKSNKKRKVEDDDDGDDE